MIVGITGKYCSGKNAVAAEFERRGYFHIEVDKLGHAALDLKKDEIEKTFGSSVISDGTVNRAALGKIVFKSKDQKHLLEKIVHPEMTQMVKKLIEEQKGKNILINAAILAQMGLHQLCDIVVWVKAPLLKRVERALLRDQLPPGAVLDRIITQRKLKSNLTGKDVDTYNINNSGNIEEIVSSVDRVLKIIDSRK
ncbi:MAG: dephospho-CoA kinase [Spirochaetales bacterium]|nr:dephospho-CoA kinase [Spirochaetales bacterium]